MHTKKLIFIMLLLVVVMLTYNDNDKNQYAVSNPKPLDQVLTIGIDEIAPNVIISNDGLNLYTGFDIDLWEAIADDLGICYRYEKCCFSDILKKLKNKEIDVGIAGITINEEREKYLNFTHHYLDSGLRTVVLISNTPLMSSLRAIFTQSTLRILLYLLIFIIICGHILWVTERGRDKISDHYFPGIAEAFWCVIATMTTVGYGDIAPERWAGRITSFIVMIIGIGLFGFVITQLSANLTVKNIETNISSYRDLRGKIVGTKEGTTSVSILQDVGAKVVTFKTIDLAYEDLLNKKLKAVVFDSPNVLYFANNQGKGKVTVLEEMFDTQYYGFALSEDCPFREDINRSLLKLRSSGEYENIYRKWFK